MAKHTYYVEHASPKGDLDGRTVKADSFHVDDGFHHFVADGETVHSFKSDHVHRIERRAPRAPKGSATAQSEISESGDQA